MNLNEQLQRAYEAGRRQGLNEQPMGNPLGGVGSPPIEPGPGFTPGLFDYLRTRGVSPFYPGRQPVRPIIRDDDGNLEPWSEPPPWRPGLPDPSLGDPKLRDSEYGYDYEWVYPDGTVLWPDGTIVYPDGTRINPDGSVYSKPNDTTYFPQGDHFYPSERPGKRRLRS